jgi:hypothetical protein
LTIRDPVLTILVCALRFMATEPPPGPIQTPPHPLHPLPQGRQWVCSSCLVVCVTPIVRLTVSHTRCSFPEPPGLPAKKLRSTPTVFSSCSPSPAAGLSATFPDPPAACSNRRRRPLFDTRPTHGPKPTPARPSAHPIPTLPKYGSPLLGIPCPVVKFSPQPTPVCIRMYPCALHPHLYICYVHDYRSTICRHDCLVASTCK